MKGLLRALLMLPTLVLPGVGLGQNIAIKADTLHTLTTQGSIRNGVVLVTDGAVTAVGAELAIPEGYGVVDAKVVTPGLIEAHTQLGIHEIGLEASTREDVLVEYAQGPSFDISLSVNPASTLFATSRMDGVTRAVLAPVNSGDPIAGWGAAIRLTDTDPVTNTQIAMFGSFTSSAVTPVGGSRNAAWQKLSRALSAAPRFQPNRYQPDDLDYSAEDMAALKSLVRGDKLLVLEVHRASEIRRALQLAERFDVRIVLRGASEGWQVAQQLAAANTPVIIDPTANLPRDFDRLGARSDNAALLANAGVTVMFTASEVHNAAWLRQIAGNAVAHGMAWQEAMRAIAANTAQVFGLPNGSGQIKVGGVADIVVWNGDPLETTSWPTQVMIDGQWQTMQSRQTRLLQRYRDLNSDQPFKYR